jgi:magnesium chelatase subunit ChlD-like protein
VGRIAPANRTNKSGETTPACQRKKVMTRQSTNGRMTGVKMLKGTQRPGCCNEHQGRAIHWLASLAQKRNQQLNIHHVRYRQRHSVGSPLHCLVIDCSASMLKQQNLSLAKGLLQACVERLYQQRAKVCVVGFGYGGVRVLQTPQRASHINEDWIAPIQGGGGSPAFEAVKRADQLLERYRKRVPDAYIELTLMSDGRFKKLPDQPQNADYLNVIDFEEDTVRLQRARLIASLWQAEYTHINKL